MCLFIHSWLGYRWPETSSIFFNTFFDAFSFPKNLEICLQTIFPRNRDAEIIFFTFESKVKRRDRNVSFALLVSSRSNGQFYKHSTLVIYDSDVVPEYQFA